MTRIAQCHHSCPGNHPCVLRSDIPHVLHGCNQPDCYCHTPRRFDYDRELDRPTIYTTPQEVDSVSLAQN